MLGRLLPHSTGLYYVPDEIKKLFNKICPKGKTAVLYSGTGDVLFNFDNSVGVEPILFVVKLSNFFKSIANSKSEIINKDPQDWVSKDTFNNIICIPPTNHLDVIEKSLSLLKEKGMAFYILPEMFFYATHYQKIRQLIK
jgi:hypothetical protein